MSTSSNPSENKSSAINVIFVLFILAAIIFAAFNGRMKEITDASFDSAKGAVTLAIGLIGIMALWLGLVRILEAGGLMYSIARMMRPIMTRLFPEVPAEHPAMGAMLLNVSANMLGLGNAATPFGIKAMVELDKLNPLKGTATNAMCLFLAINTSSITILPLGVIGVRAAAGSTNPAEIFLPTLLATLCSTFVAVVVATFLSKLDRDSSTAPSTPLSVEQEVKGEDQTEEESEASDEESFDHLRMPSTKKAKATALLAVVLFFTAAISAITSAESSFIFFTDQFLTYWLMPFLMLAMICFGVYKGVKIYEAVTEGAKQGFDIAIRIIPFLVAILVAIAMFRASGAMELLTYWISPYTTLIGMPADALPMALVRPLSGSGAFGVMSSLVTEAPNSYKAYVASTMMGSTETTFYVLAVYFGAVGVTRIRHAMVAALAADATGILVSCLACKMLWAG